VIPPVRSTDVKQQQNTPFGARSSVEVAESADCRKASFESLQLLRRADFAVSSRWIFAVQIVCSLAV